MSIFFRSIDRKILVKQQKKIKVFLKHLFTSERKKLKRVDYVFCSDEYLLKINTEFLHHNFYTDVISFPYNKEDEPIEGEIFLSVDRIIDNAQKYKVSADDEVIRLIFHGALHLCGYRDDTSEEQKQIRSAENKYLNQYMSFEGHSFT